jgi:D-arginine dehydrogenase
VIGTSARAGGLAEHPVLTPRGALFVARHDQLASLDAMSGEIRAQVTALERLDAAQVLARVPVLRTDYVAVACTTRPAWTWTSRRSTRVIRRGFARAAVPWSPMPR